MAERETFYLVCDTSGSMAEGGKRMLMRGIARTVEQCIRLGDGAAEIKLVLWNTTAAVADWEPSDELPAQLLECGGSSNASALIKTLGEKPDGNVLFLTDGWWSEDEKKVLKKWRKSLPSETLRIIKIGADANPLLKGDDVFAAEDIITALDGWLKPASTDGADSWD
jgi:hypothetical protein